MADDWLKEGIWCYDPPAQDTKERDYLATILKPGMTFWDIGANAGLYSMVALSYGCDVLAIEPNFYALTRFVRNVNENREQLAQQYPQQTLVLLTVAIADTSGRYDFSMGDAHNRGSLGDIKVNQNPMMQVQTCTLDDLYNGFGRPDVIKIDGNGAESMILAGGGDLWDPRWGELPILIVKFDAQHKGLSPSSDNFNQLPDLYEWWTLEGVKIENPYYIKKHKHMNLVAIPR